MNKKKKRKNSNNIVCFYPERALQKAISKSTVGTVISLKTLLFDFGSSKGDNGFENILI